MKYFRFCLIAVLMLFAPAAYGSTAAKHTFSIKEGRFWYDGKPVQLHSGELHYARVPEAYWRHRLRMIRAMGLNAVATYVFWNYHETSPGVWDWKTENRNLRRFVEMAGEEGLMVILRPGPYCCAEWEFGGYPWWLQKVENMVIRADNAPFLQACRSYIGELAAQVKDLQVTYGGPIVMVQAENEFGSYVAQRKDITLASHRSYSAKIRQQLLDAGFDVPMFTSDGSWLFEGGTIAGALPTANGEGNIENLKKVVDQYHGGKGPYMVAEFYPGWLDHWNEPFNRVGTDQIVNQTRKYLDAQISFNFYMVHGGTNFGFTSGANYSNDRDIQPDLTSYDYDAPINEAGWNTPKYDALRKLMKEKAGYPIPDVPEKIPVIALPVIALSETADVLSMLDKTQPIEADRPLCFEALNQGHGYVLYRRRFTQPLSGMMKIPGLADFAVVYVNGTKLGELNRVTGKDSLAVEVPFNAVLDILVENMGRINYGARITENLKGIVGQVTIDGHPIDGNWRMYSLPMDCEPDVSRLSRGYRSGLPVLYKGTFDVVSPGDTFIDMQGWGKGIVFVNGINLGRYWRVGPQQTLYLPGCYLKKGKNTIVIFEQLNETRHNAISTVSEPVLDKLIKE